MNNLDQCIKHAIDICEGKFVKQEFSEIYPFTTENISGYINKFDLNNKSLLTLGSSSDQAINAIIKDCKDISILDICPFTKFYFYLKKAAILSLNYDEFLFFFCYRDSYPQLKDKIFNKEMFFNFKQLLRLLDYESYLFWDELFSCYDSLTIRKNMFEYDEDSKAVLKKTNLYLNNKNIYNKCKKEIKNINPKFIIGDIKNIKLERNYDNIWLSNLGQYLKIKDLKKVVDNLFVNLNEEGKMLVCYLYQTTKDTKYKEEWAKIYNLEEVYKEFNNYKLQLDSFIGVRGIMFDYKKAKDSILVYKKTLN